MGCQSFLPRALQPQFFYAMSFILREDREADTIVPNRTSPAPSAAAFTVGTAKRRYRKGKFFINTQRLHLYRVSFLGKRTLPSSGPMLIAGMASAGAPIHHTALAQIDGIEGQIANARSITRYNPSLLVLAGHSGQSTRTRSSHPSSFSRNFLGLEYSALPS